MRLVLPESMDAPTISDSFLRRMRDIDSGLVIYWNRFRQRFVVDRCINTAPHTHGIECQRSNVLIVENEEGGYMTPCDRVLDKIKSMDAWGKFGDISEGGLDRFRRTHELAKEEYDNKVREDSRENYKAGAREDRVQLNKALHLMQQHDFTRVNQ